MALITRAKRKAKATGPRETVEDFMNRGGSVTVCEPIEAKRDEPVTISVATQLAFPDGNHTVPPHHMMTEFNARK